jgi:hypothetical protein
VTPVGPQLRLGGANQAGAAGDKTRAAVHALSDLGSAVGTVGDLDPRILGYCGDDRRDFGDPPRTAIA